MAYHTVMAVLSDDTDSIIEKEDTFSVFFEGVYAAHIVAIGIMAVVRVGLEFIVFLVGAVDLLAFVFAFGELHGGEPFFSIDVHWEGQIKIIKGFYVYTFCEFGKI